jgi:hypothetical protein
MFCPRGDTKTTHHDANGEQANMSKAIGLKEKTKLVPMPISFPSPNAVKAPQ